MLAPRLLLLVNFAVDKILFPKVSIEDEIAIDAEDTAADGDSAAEPAGDSAENCKPMPLASGLHSSKGASEIVVGRGHRARGGDGIGLDGAAAEYFPARLRVRVRGALTCDRQCVMALMRPL